MTIRWCSYTTLVAYSCLHLCLATSLPNYYALFMTISLPQPMCNIQRVYLAALGGFQMPALYRDSDDRTDGFWGEPTSTLDWCEENYVVTKYVAEFWNSITNYFMVVPPLLAALRCYQQRMGRRFIMCFLSLMVVGIGSTLFHATLRYEMQLLDELPMIYATCVFLYCVATCDSEPQKRNIGLKLFFSCFCIMITVVYIVVVNPLLFQWTYGLTVAALIILTVHTYRKHDISTRLFFTGILSYGLGFILWNIDNNFCPQVRLFRRSLPWPLDTFGQLHGWWHFLAAFGTYFQIMYSIELRIKCLRNQRKLDQNGWLKNGGSSLSDLHSYEKHLFPTSFFWEFWCGLPFEPEKKPTGKHGLNNNQYCNGCKPM